MHAATLALLTKNATIWEHEVFVIVVIATRQINFFLKNCENNGKNVSFNLGFIDNFLSSVCYYA